jgi:hypothetical protein
MVQQRGLRRCNGDNRCLRSENGGEGDDSVCVKEQDFESVGRRSDDFGDVRLDGLDYVHSIIVRDDGVAKLPAAGF